MNNSIEILVRTESYDGASRSYREFCYRDRDEPCDNNDVLYTVASWTNGSCTLRLPGESIDRTGGRRSARAYRNRYGPCGDDGGGRYGVSCGGGGEAAYTVRQHYFFLDRCFLRTWDDALA